MFLAAFELNLPPLPGEAQQAPEQQAGRRNLQQLVQLRWLAVIGQLITIVTVRFALGIELPAAEMLALLAMLALFNLVSALSCRAARPVGHGELLAALLVDVGVLGIQLFYAGGITNPFIFLFLLQVAVGAMLLGPTTVWVMVVITSLVFIALTLWHLPLRLPDGSSPALSVDYIGGLLICYVLCASLLVVFIGRIGRILQRRDARLAEMRQRAAEEEHIMRMGLLASGAAHELGTPLATLSVILGDWARMAPFAAEPELREEIEEMQVQVQRCKHIVTSILLSAGETRGESPHQSTLRGFLDDLVADWRRTRQPESFIYLPQALPPVALIADTALQQMIYNVLDNALEAAPTKLLQFSAGVQEDMLVLRVIDRGPGFAAETLARFGKPYNSTKGRPGGGLGLFLSVNVARSLGGTIEALNRTMLDGGAEVVIRLPLSALMPLPEPDDEH